MSTTEAIIERLRLSGHRLTASRRAALEAIAASDDHFSVAEVQQRLPTVGRATLFRTIRLLVDLGLLCRVLLEDGSLRYRLSRRPTHHHHLVCTACGDVEDFADCDLAALSKELTRRTAYEIRGHWLEMYGLCPACRAPTTAGGRSK
jgi:Fur family ferric uptake transcriptional regulator